MEAATNLLGRIGRGALDVYGGFRGIRALSGETIYWIFLGPWKGKPINWRNSSDQVVKIGVDSLMIVSLIAFFVGLILAMQSAYQLQQFGATIFTANLVAVSLIRELSPLLTAIVIAGRSGSAIAAEIGTMAVSEEIDALRTMGLNPVRFLVVPRTLGMIIALPCLTIIADLIGIFGGYVLVIMSLDIASSRYIQQTIEAMLFKDLFSGLFKSAIFALIIASISCYQGLRVRGGAEGVGKATTRSVVMSIFMIIVADVVFTALFYSAL